MELSVESMDPHDSLDLFDDAESLEAMLALLDSEDGPGLLLAPDELEFGSSDDSVHTECTERTRKKPVRRKISGSTRVKMELETVRTQARELEKQLELLQSRERGRPPSSTVQTATTTVANVGIWKRVAERQYRARRETEVANTKLRTTVEEQRKVTQQILRAIKRGNVKPDRPDSRQDVDLNGFTTSHHMQQIVDHDASVDASKIAQLISQVNAMMLQVDEFLQDPAFQSSGESPVSTSRSYDDGSMAVLNSRTVPFDADVVSDSIWSYYADRTTEANECPFQDFIDDDLMIKGFRMMLGAAFQLGCIEGVIVGRRFIHHGRTVIVWAADIEPVGTGGLSAHMSDLLSFEATGWNVVSCVNRDGASLSTIQMKHCARPTRRNLHKPPSSGVMAQMLKKFVIQGIQEHQETVHRCVDDTFISHHADNSIGTKRRWLKRAATNLLTRIPGIALHSV